MAPYEFSRTWAFASGDGMAIPACITPFIPILAVPGYFESMAGLWRRTLRRHLDGTGHTRLFPNLMVKGPIQLLRLFNDAPKDAG